MPDSSRTISGLLKRTFILLLACSFTPDVLGVESRKQQKPTQVKLYYRVTTDHKGTITCEVSTQSETIEQSADETSKETGQPMSAVYLICPQVSTSVCYMDCTPSCVLNEHGCGTPKSISEVIERCSYERLNSTRVRVSYVINLRRVNQTGQWDCDYRGQRTLQPLELQASVQNLTETIVMRPPELVKPVLVESTPNRHLEIGSSKRAAEEFAPNGNTDGSLNFKSAIRNLPSTNFLPAIDFRLTRPELVVVFLAALGLSLLLNACLIIRCVLMKIYVDNIFQNKSDPCLESLLCFPQREVYKRTQFTRPIFVKQPASDFIHCCTNSDHTYSTSHGRSQLSPMLNGGLYCGPNAYRPIQSNVDDLILRSPEIDDAVGSNSSGPYSRVHRVPFFNDLTQPTPPIPARTHENHTTVTYGLPCAEAAYHPAMSMTNGSLTGSMILTNESTSLTGANITPIPMPQSPVHANMKHSYTEHTFTDPCVPLRNETSYTSFSRIRRELSLSRGSSRPKYSKTSDIDTQMVQSVMCASNSTEDVHLRHTSRVPGYHNPLMTPLVVRFPTGEAGLLICPKNKSRDNLEIGSLNRRRVPNNLHHRRFNPMSWKQHVTNTDTESDSACTDFAFIDTVTKDSSPKSRPTVSPVETLANTTTPSLMNSATVEETKELNGYPDHQLENRSVSRTDYPMPPLFVDAH